jgi:hypothetical protein
VFGMIQEEEEEENGAVMRDTHIRQICALLRCSLGLLQSWGLGLSFKSHTFGKDFCSHDAARKSEAYRPNKEACCDRGLPEPRWRSPKRKCSFRSRGALRPFSANLFNLVRRRRCKRQKRPEVEEHHDQQSLTRTVTRRPFCR